MLALVKETRGPGLAMREVPKPTAKAGEVLVKICKTAICGTDLHIYNWDEWSQTHLDPPVIIGHEFVGEIAELGEGVTGWNIGQRVSAEGHIVCGHCRSCRAGNGQFCPNTVGIGVATDGIFAEYAVIPAQNLCAIPDDIPDDIVSFFDAYGNATHTALAFDLVGEDVLITGAGPIGIMAAAICRHSGARRVVITDVNEYRLDLAKKMGATAAVNVAKQDLRKIMEEQGLVEGFDVGLEMSGNGAAFNQMLGAMRNGGKVALLGIAAKGTVIDWNDVIFKGLTLQGIYGRKMFETWYKMQAMIQAGLDLNPIITHRFDARDYQLGFEAMASGKSGKVILDWTKIAEEGSSK